MDHLPSIELPVRPLLRVPYLCSALPKCAHGLFHQYLAQVGFGAEEEEDLLAAAGSFGHRNLEEVAAILQEWCFFGILCEVFETGGIQFRREDFIVKLAPDHSTAHNSSDGPRDLVVSTEALHRYLWLLVVQQVCNTDEHRREEVFDRIHASLSTMNACVNGVVRAQAAGKLGPRTADPPGMSSSLATFDIVLLSISILGFSLDKARQRADRMYGLGSSTALPWELPNAASTLLLQAGWCKAEVRDICAKFDVAVVYYLGTFNKLQLGKDHSACGARCVADQIVDETLYKTRHVDIRCNCRHYSESEMPSSITNESTARILERGGIPVMWISTSDASGGALEIHVQDSSMAPYVAISHVWSDGLGNPHNNSLPRCQLERIQKIVDRLDRSTPGEQQRAAQGHTPFWMDTLCVPLEKEYRKLAIQRMGRTYSEADKVLVLDRFFDDASISCTNQEALVRLGLSSWTKRLWTFQEGILAKDLRMQLRDGAITLPTMSDEPAYSAAGFAVLGKYLNDKDEILKSDLKLRLVRAMVLQIREVESLLQECTIMEEQGDSDEEGLDHERIYAHVVSHTFAEYKTSLRRWLTIHPLHLRILWENIVETSQTEFPDELDATVVDAIQYRLPDAIDNMGRSLAQQALADRLTSRAPYAQRPGYHLIKFGLAVRTRMTSKRDDETLCLGGILGLDLSRLLKHSGNRRMEEFFSMLDECRADIIFSRSERLPEYGFRWAPSTFLNGKFDCNDDSRTSTPYGRRTSKGLLVPWEGLLLPLDAVLPRGSDLRILRTGMEQAVNSGRLGFLALELEKKKDEKRTSYVTTAHLDDVGGGVGGGGSGEWNKYAGKHIAIIIRSFARSRHTEGALVTVLQSDGSTFLVQFEAVVSLETDIVDSSPVAVDVTAEFLAYGRQLWCVG